MQEAQLRVLSNVDATSRAAHGGKADINGFWIMLNIDDTIGTVTLALSGKKLQGTAVGLTSVATMPAAPPHASLVVMLICPFSSWKRFFNTSYEYSCVALYGTTLRIYTARVNDQQVSLAVPSGAESVNDACVVYITSVSQLPQIDILVVSCLSSSL